MIRFTLLFLLASVAYASHTCIADRATILENIANGLQITPPSENPDAAWGGIVNGVATLARADGKTTPLVVIFCHSGFPAAGVVWWADGDVSNKQVIFYSPGTAWLPGSTIAVP